MEKPLPPELTQNIIEILYYAFGVFTTWIIKVFQGKKPQNK